MTNKNVVSVETLFHKHCANKSAANAAINTLKKAFGVDELTPDVLLHADFCKLCNAKGIGRKTIILVAEVACDLSKMK